VVVMSVVMVVVSVVVSVSVFSGLIYDRLLGRSHVSISHRGRGNVSGLLVDYRRRGYIDRGNGLSIDDLGGLINIMVVVMTVMVMVAPGHFRSNKRRSKECACLCADAKRMNQKSRVSVKSQICAKFRYELSAKLPRFGIRHRCIRV
jgi:hypothetical protein